MKIQEAIYLVKTEDYTLLEYAAIQLFIHELYGQGYEIILTQKGGDLKCQKQISKDQHPKI